MTARRRVLTDWDLAASGSWTILSPEELRAPTPPGRWRGTRRFAPRARAWADRLSEDLLDVLEARNRDGETLDWPPGATDAQRARFSKRAAELAERV
ncbi:MAG: hypothetical protein M0Z95_24275 [Actinomycetota bacterium]|nr:hypothetical protein [Actinomycetota bacterium]